MSEPLMKFHRRLPSTFLVAPHLRARFQLLYLLVSLNILFFFIVYHRLVLITSLTPSTFMPTTHQEYPPTTAICPIPRFDPWDQTVAKSIRLKPLYRCPTQKGNLIVVMNSNQLFIDQIINRTSYLSAITHCIYLKVDRNPEEKYFKDWSYTLSKAILIVNGSTAPILDADFVLTRCFTNRSAFFRGESFCGYNCPNHRKVNQTEKQFQTIVHNDSMVYEYVHPLIRLKKSAFSPTQSSHRPPPSVLVIILDAVSDLQARRALPKTLRYLESLGLYTFKRHAIVGDGTFENIVPMLFGQTAVNLQKIDVNDSRYDLPTTEVEIDPQTKKSIEISKLIHYPGPYDNYSFILKNFSRLNYTTFFSEEWRESAFYNLKNGFRQAPADFYLRPYWLSLYETLSYHQFMGNSNPKPCYLDKLLHLLSLNWLRDFLTVHHSSPTHPTFGVMKINEMSHDYLERLFWIDQDLKAFFQDLVERHLLDNTIVLFCGDHGHRQHRLRLTRIGSFEAKLPFFSMLLPQAFKEDFPQATQHLQRNQEVLTSWWDVYETLANILQMVVEPDLSDPLRVHWHRTTPGTSLFHPIPERDCAAAGIPEKYCPCSRSSPVDPSSSIIHQMALLSIDYINNVKLKDHKQLCVVLQLKKIIRAEVEELHGPQTIDNKTLPINYTHSYTVLFEVSPSDGIFESRVLYDQISTKDTRLHSEILRINLYGQASACIKDKYDLRSFCYCKSFRRKSKHALSHPTSRH